MIPFLQPFAHLYTPEWRTSDSLLESIEALLKKYKPRSILEFGPGLSSFLFYRYAKENEASYWAYDHESPFAHKHIHHVHEARYDSDNISVLPLDSNQGYDFQGRVIPIADFVFIDGPPSSKARYELYHIFCRPLFKPSIFVIDDTHRLHELHLAINIAHAHNLRPFHIHDILFPPRTSIVLIPGDNRI